VEFLVNSLFDETKIQTADTKVKVYSKFRKKIRNKLKSPLSMNSGRITTSMCRGKLQKMGVLKMHPPPPPKKPRPLLQARALQK
jgi:hypothetical protein